MTPKPFRFSVQASNTPSASAWRELARKVEDQGYSTLFMPDHYVDAASNGGQGIAPVPALGMVAGVTTSLRIGTRVLCIDYHHPAVLAKEIATLDLLSDGRVELGLGAGWVASEYQALDLAMDPAGTRIARLKETVDYLDHWFSGETLEFAGEHITAAGYKGQPLAVQQPRPPLMIGGGARRVLTYAGSVADIVSLNFDNRAGVVGPASIASSTAEATDDKIAWIRAGAGERFDSIELEMGAYFTVVTDDAAATAEKMGSMFGVPGEVMAAVPHTLIGSVGEICELLQARRERYGISYVSVSDRSADAFAPVVAQLAGT
jgi:probable F420-dependent oxidoreductase